MHVNKWLLGTAGVLTIVVTVAVTWLHAATPTVGAIVANPVHIGTNTPTRVTIAVIIADVSVLPGGVNLLQTDAAGKTIATIGVMHDDGTSGDALAGDKLFSYQVVVNQAAVGPVYYRASVAFRGLLQRVLSNVAAVTIEPWTGAAGDRLSVSFKYPPTWTATQQL